MIHIRKIFLLLLFAGPLFWGVQGCSVDGDGFYAGAFGLGKGSILITSAPGATLYTVTQYSLDGKFQRVLWDTTALGLIPRGMAQLDPFRVLIAMDGIDSLWALNLATEKTEVFYQGSLLSGNIYQPAQRGNSSFVIESNTIERLDNGNRFPATGGSYIPATVGSCTISTARGLAVNSGGNLLVTSFTNGAVHLYDVSGSTPSCLATNNSYGGGQPVPIIAHSNGNLYFATQSNNSIYYGPDDLSSAPQRLIDQGITTPTAMAELPDGSILVANDGTADVIIRIDPDSGEILDGNFIKNAFTGTVTSILVVPPF